MTPQDRWKKAKVAIMQHKKFCAFTGIMACGKSILSDEIPTAKTDGMNITFSPTFMATLTDHELRFVLLHEAMHIAYKHLWVWRDLWTKDPKLVNIAADHFVNLALVEMDAGGEFIVMPKIGVQPDSKYHGWSVSMIYDDLRKQGQGQGQGKGQGQGQGQGKGQGQGQGQEGFDDHDWESASNKTQEQRDAEAQEIDRALRQGEMLARKRSKGAGGADGVFGDLLAPKNDWRALLREFVQEQCQGRDESTWRRPHRRFIGDDVYMPSSVSETMGELVIGMDTSGSCFSGTVMTRFVSELTAIITSMSPERVRVVYWDYGVRSEQVFDQGQFSVDELSPRGGGGTDGACLFDYLREKQIRPQAIVQFTDGEVGDWGHSDAPTLWVITHGHITAPWGRTIHMDV